MSSQMGDAIARIVAMNNLSYNRCRLAVAAVAVTQPVPLHETADRLYLLLADWQSQHPLVKLFWQAYEREAQS